MAFSTSCCAKCNQMLGVCTVCRQHSSLSQRPCRPSDGCEDHHQCQRKASISCWRLAEGTSACCVAQRDCRQFFSDRPGQLKCMNMWVRHKCHEVESPNAVRFNQQPATSRWEKLIQWLIMQLPLMKTRQGKWKQIDLFKENLNVLVTVYLDSD